MLLFLFYRERRKKMPAPGQDSTTDVESEVRIPKTSAHRGGDESSSTKPIIAEKNEQVPSGQLFCLRAALLLLLLGLLVGAGFLVSDAFVQHPWTWIAAGVSLAGLWMLAGSLLLVLICLQRS